MNRILRAKLGSVLTAFVATACVSTTLETPSNHPANPNAESAPLPATRVLQKDFDASSVDDKSAPPSGDHQPHETHGDHHSTKKPNAEPSPEEASFTCPMHPEIVRKQPGRCPICGMNLVKQARGKDPHKGAHH